MAYQNSVATRNAKLVTEVARLNSGLIRIYSGTKPLTPDTALSGNTLLAELTFGATAFAAPSAGSATANAIAQDASADATGTATFARLFQSNGTTVEGDCNVGTTGSDINLSSVSIIANGPVSISSMTLAQP